MTPVRDLLILAATLSGALAGGCAPLTVNSFVERGVNLAEYRTYAWGPSDRLETGDPRLDNNPFFDAAVRGAVERRLAARGLERASAAPDVLLHYHASVGQQVLILGERRDGYCVDCKPEVYEAGTLVIDVVDARTNTLLWRGWAEGTIDRVIDDQKWMEETIARAVERILARYPRS